MSRGGASAAMLLAVTALAAAAAWAGAFVLLRSPQPVPGAAPSPVTVLETPVPGPPPPGAAGLPPFAVSDGVRLRLVSTGAVAVAFHEASYGDAVAMRPLGRCEVCRNRQRFTPPRPRVPDLGYIVEDTRGRETPATSAADIVLPRGETVLSPVGGAVVRVKRYRLYGRYPDVRVAIRPSGVPDRRVVLIHLESVSVGLGRPVEAGLTPLGTVRRFPFESHVDRYVREGLPHVHVEVKDPEARRQTTA